jgi:hypothetical protein
MVTRLTSVLSAFFANIIFSGQTPVTVAACPCGRTSNFLPCVVAVAATAAAAEAAELLNASIKSGLSPSAKKSRNSFPRLAF